jgi:hypothetical protein
MTKKSTDKPVVGALRVWWVPQVPMHAFYVPVESVKEAEKILTVLADYDVFQYYNKIKPDYCNVGGIEIYDANADGEGNPGWISWDDDEIGFEKSEEHTVEED